MEMVMDELTLEQRELLRSLLEDSGDLALDHTPPRRGKMVRMRVVNKTNKPLPLAA